MAFQVMKPENPGPTCPELPSYHIDDLLAPGVVHTFLMRSPKQSILSRHMILEYGFRNGNIGMNREDSGNVPLAQLYDFIAAHSSEQPLVMDADSLLRNPEAVLKELCRRGGIDYDPKMLDWEPTSAKAKQMFGKFPMVHDVALSTTTFVETKQDVDMDKLPEEVKWVIEDAMPHYERMKKVALTV